MLGLLSSLVAPPSEKHSRSSLHTKHSLCPLCFSVKTSPSSRSSVKSGIEKLTHLASTSSNAESFSRIHTAVSLYDDFIGKVLSATSIDFSIISAFIGLRVIPPYSSFINPFAFSIIVTSYSCRTIIFPSIDLNFMITIGLSFFLVLQLSAYHSLTFQLVALLHLLPLYLF